MGIATILLDHGLITREQLELALIEQKQTGERLDHTLIRLGMVRPGDVTRTIGEQFNMPIVDLNEIDVEEDILQLIPPQVVFGQKCIPIARRAAPEQHAAHRSSASPPAIPSSS